MRAADTVAVAEEEIRCLLGAGRSMEAAASAARSRSRGCIPSLARWRRTEPIPVGKPRNAEQIRRHREEVVRATQPGHFKCLALNRQLVVDCLHHYNSMHPHDEHEPAPGEVTEYIRLHSGGSWTHGNFVARRKRSGGCFSFLPAPRTLFFFELLRFNGFEGVVTCIPLDEPVTEGYSILGFPIWWGTRRNGRWDCICKTCYGRFDSPDALACGHDKAERICEMCHGRSTVLHPFPGEFARGYREYMYRFSYR